MVFVRRGVPIWVWFYKNGGSVALVITRFVIKMVVYESYFIFFLPKCFTIKYGFRRTLIFYNWCVEWIWKFLFRNWEIGDEDGSLRIDVGFDSKIIFLVFVAPRCFLINAALEERGYSYSWLVVRVCNVFFSRIARLDVFCEMNRFYVLIVECNWVLYVFFYFFRFFC